MLGAAITATLAGWGTTEPYFTSKTDVTSSFTGGIGGYPGNVSNSAGITSVASSWTYDTTDGTAVWGVFTAATVYIPTSALNAATDSANTNSNSTQTNILSTEITDGAFFDAVGLRINTGVGGSPAVNTFTFDPRFTGGTQFPTGIAKTTLADRWLTILVSYYDTAANYTSWSPPSGATGDVYGRLVILDTVAGTTVSQQDQRFTSNSNMFNYYKSNIAYSTSGPDLDFKAFDNTTVYGGTQLVHPWTHFGGTLDPASASVYSEFIGFHTPSPGVRPTFNCVQRSTSDYTTVGSEVYIANNATARVTTASNTPLFSNNTSVQGTLTYL
jgi:hypothetical protein